MIEGNTEMAGAANVLTNMEIRTPSPPSTVVVGAPNTHVFTPPQERPGSFG